MNPILAPLVVMESTRLLAQPLLVNARVTFQLFRSISFIFLIDCEDKNCNACSGAGTGKCSSCVANTYLNSETKTCVDCEVGYYSDKGATECSSKF